MILHLNYDLTQKYRRTQIYQNKSFISEDCDYDSIDLDFNKIKMKCKYKQSLDYSYIQKESVLNISNEKIEKYLCFRCVNYVKIEMNIGFWIHLILIILGIIIEIIFWLNENKISFKGIGPDLKNNDKAFKEKIEIRQSTLHPNDINVGQSQIRENNINNDNVGGNIGNSPRKNNGENSENVSQENSKYDSDGDSSNNKNTYFQIFSENIQELHPIINLKNLSNCFPLNLKCNCFIFNIFQIFFFNSILYSEKIIERRIYNKNRSNIFYPITNEYGKLLLSIIISMVCLFIIKLIIIYTIEQKDKLNSKTQVRGVIDKNKACDDFKKKMFLRRLIAEIIILIFSLFSFFYVTVFCSLYRKTQINWFLGGIYCLIFEWVILSNLYIAIISFVQQKEKEDVVHYMKVLFCF